MYTYHLLFQTSIDIDATTRQALLTPLLTTIGRDNPEFKVSTMGLALFQVEPDESKLNSNFLFTLEKNNIHPSENDKTINSKGEDTLPDGRPFKWYFHFIFMQKSAQELALLSAIWLNHKDMNTFQFLPNGMIAISTSFGIMQGIWKLDGFTVTIETQRPFQFTYKGSMTNNDAIIGTVTHKSYGVDQSDPWDIRKQG